MKTIKRYITERFISSTSPKKLPLYILDKKISSLSDLSEIAEKYFKELGYDVKLTKIQDKRIVWTYKNHSKHGLIITKSFELKFINNEKPVKRLRFGYNSSNELFFIQLIEKLGDSADSWKKCGIHGTYTKNNLERDTNFLSFIESIKKSTETNDWFDRDTRLVNLFYNTNLK